MQQDESPATGRAPSLPASDAGASIVPPMASRARVRHDVFTPLNHIIGYAEMLLEDEFLPETYRRDLDRILRSGRKLGSLVGMEFGSEGDEEKTIDLRQLFYDLRTPVNGIIGYSELLTEEAALERRSQLSADLRKIGRAAQEFLSLTERYFLLGREQPIRPTSGPPVEDQDANVDGTDQKVLLRGTAPVPQRPVTGSILLIDDDRQTREILSRRLVAAGHVVEGVENGPAGIARLRSAPIDLVLVDMVMPGMSGAEVLAAIKSDPTLAEIPVIVISALDDEEGIARCIELGAEDYLSKPFNPAVLRARVATSLEKRHLRLAEKEHLSRIVRERRRSEDLLLNVLPESIATRLKAGEERIADHFPDVSVLFADIVGFTSLSTIGDPSELVETLNTVFSVFDLLADRHGLEKIKTIGDAYMVVGGLPIPRQDHAHAMANFALELVREMDRLNAGRESRLALRIGIATGPVIAGIIGRRKFIYDLWGDTVNTASRMESHGSPGRIQVTTEMFERLKDAFEFEPVGAKEIKGKGMMETYFLCGSVS